VREDDLISDGKKEGVDYEVSINRYEDSAM